MSHIIIVAETYKQCDIIARKFMACGVNRVPAYVTPELTRQLRGIRNCILVIVNNVMFDELFYIHESNLKLNLTLD